MDIYQLDYILHEPEESEGWMYLAEVSALQGCMAWGDTPEQTLDELRAVAKALIQSRQERGMPLPPEVTPQRTGKGSCAHWTDPPPVNSRDIWVAEIGVFRN